MRLRYAAFLAAVPALALLAPDASAQCDGRSRSSLYKASALRAVLLPSATLFTGNLGGQFVIDSLNVRVVSAASPWIAGQVNGELRVSAQMDGENRRVSFQPGPLTAQGTAADGGCSRFNRVWIVTQADLNAYAASGATSADLAEWPYDAGAPVTDGDGNPGNYNLAGGDRPTLWGEATAWYVLNDVAYHPYPDANSIGLEVQVTVGSANRGLPGALIVRHRLVYKPTTNAPLTDAYFGMWSRSGLGYPVDDFVGTDSTLSLLYYYNSDNDDENNLGGFGRTTLPAAGVQILQGPRISGDGNASPNSSLLARSGIQHTNGNGPDGLPTTPTHFQNYLRGLWKNGFPLTEGGNGYGGFNTTHFVFSGMPPSYWSEDKLQPTSPYPSSPDNYRQGILSSGPFTMQPGETQDVISAFSFAFGSDRIDAVRNLKAYAASLLAGYPVANDTDARPSLAVTLGPNPTRGTLRGTVPSGQPATVALYDLLGREIRTLAVLPSGGSFTADVAGATPGVYLVRIAQGTATAWQRIVVMR